jgi:glutathione S-transferase
MAQYIEVEQALGMPGLRVVLTPGVPGPWSESAKGILHVKKIPYVKVRQILGAENPALRQWTAQETAPAFVYNDERPRSIWSDQLYLVERIAPAPALIPANLEDRARMFGLANELCGENGLGWARRLMILHGGLSNPKVPEAGRKFSTFMGNKYGYSTETAQAAPERVAAILESLARQLEAQRKRASRFLVGDALSALDIYWACFAALIEPLPDELCRITPAFRAMYHCTDPAVTRAASPELFAHRDFIYREYLELPVDL